MSSALRIASVTHVLKDLLNDGLINRNVSAVVGTAINVTSLPPGQVEPQQGNATSQLNLFMHRVSYNTGWNNIGYPSRDTRGRPVSNPPLALNLHYLLTAFGEVELHAEILLGYAMQLLHENPALDRDLIRNSLSVASAANPGGRLPSDLLGLATSGLAEQFEQIKIAPESLNTEEMSKLWTAFQTKYRPCTAYVVTVVLIESDKPTSSPLPVMRRNVYAVPFRHPVINKILSSPNVANAAISEFRRIVTGDILVLEGEQLKSESVTVKIGDVEIAPVDDNVSSTRISIELDAALGLKAGIHGVQVVQPNEVVEGKRNLTNWEELDGWVSGSNYSLDDVVVIHNVVEESSIAYRCLAAHVASGNFSNDLNNNNWEILAKRRKFKGTYSNLQAFVLSPSITNITTTSSPIPDSIQFDANIEVDVNLGVYKDQKIILFLNEINTAVGTNPMLYSFVLPLSDWDTIPLTSPTNTIPFNVGPIKAGEYLVRIQVDGAASPLDTNNNGEFTGPTLNIP